MNKQKLLSAIEKFPELTAKELDSLEQLIDEYPYFQIAHTLIAKSHKDNFTLQADSKLHLASIYATDRKHLQKLISEPGAGTVTVAEPVEQTEPEVVEEKPEEVTASEAPVVPEESAEKEPAVIEEATEETPSSETEKNEVAEEESPDLIVNSGNDSIGTIEATGSDENPIYKELQETINALKSSIHTFDEDDEPGETTKSTELKTPAPKKAPATQPKSTTAKKTTGTKKTAATKTTAAKAPATKKKTAPKTAASKKSAATKTSTTKKAKSTTAKTTKKTTTSKSSVSKKKR